jgi:pyruvate dehydrogenase (quinone)
MARTVADQLVETLAPPGVRCLYGIVADSLDGIADAIRRQGKIEWLHVKAVSGRGDGLFDLARTNVWR